MTRLLICQMSVEQRRDLTREWVNLSEVESQLTNSLGLIKQLKPNLVVMPETCYFPEYKERYRAASASRLIVAGSYYNDDGINQTHYFLNGEHAVLDKLFPSPKEVMEINYPSTMQPDELFANWESQIRQETWPEYFVRLPNGDQYVVILNCMDYYKLGYYVASSSLIAPQLWGIVSPCSNGQQDIFLRLSQAMHDSNSRLYSIVVNSNNASRSADSDQGMSYVYGPATRNIKEYCAEKYGWTDPHPAAICHLGTGAKAVVMDLLPPPKVEFFARSRDFRSNPTGIKIFDL